MGLLDFEQHVARAWAAAMFLLCVTACGSSDQEPPREALSPSALDGLAPDAGGGVQTLAPISLARAPKVIVLGDSIAAGLHLPANEAWPAVMAGLLQAEGLPIHLVNAGVSGDTTAGGLARLDWLLRQDPDIMIVELGANDGLRGVALDSVEANLRAILTRLENESVETLLLGMKVPPSYGDDYTSSFEEIFTRLAHDTGVASVPFFLEGVAGDPELNLPDGIHPTTAGHKIVAQNVLPALREIVKDFASASE